MNTHKALARQWRPQSFNNFIGQPHAVKALKQSLQRQEIHHAHLFTGTRGVGKTSLARVFAKGLSCQQGITDSPCEKCDHCMAIEQGTYIDLIEIDAASKTKVDDTKELLNQITYPPVHGRFKIYIIDEVHSLSANSFNALLKTLEEPPEHVKFVLATTDPQKLPITIQSRCLQLHLQHHQESHISGHLENILKSLNKNYDKQAIEQLAKAADGSLRDALSLLEQAIATSEDTLENATICQMLGSAPTEDIITLIHAISLKDNIEVSETLTKMEHNNHNYETIIDQMLNMLYQTTKQQILPNAKREANPDIAKLANAIDSNQIQMYIQILLQGKKDISLYPSQVMGFNLIVMRMLAFKLEENNLLSLIEKKNLTLTEKSPNLEKHQRTMKTNINTSNQTASEILKQTSSQISTKSTNNRATSNKNIAQTHAKIENPENPQATQEERKPTENDWKMVMESSQISGMIRQLLSQATLKNSPNESKWEIEVDQALNKIATPGFQAKIEQICTKILERKVTIGLHFKQENKASIQSEIPTNDRLTEKADNEKILHDQNLQAFAKDLNAKPIIETIKKSKSTV